MDKEDVLFLYFVGLFFISVGIGILLNSWGWVILSFGLGCTLISAIYGLTRDLIESEDKDD